MSKQYNIRWKQSDSEELTKAVRNFNAKIDRAAKKLSPREREALPERASVRELKKIIVSRNDLNRELRALRSFSKKGAEELVDVPGSDYNLKITKRQKTQMLRRASQINKAREKERQEIADLDMTRAGKSLGYSRGDFGMGKASELSLRPVKAFTPKMTRTDLRKKYKGILKESQSTYWSQRDELLRENIKKAIRDNFREEDIQEVLEAIDKMNPKQLRKIFEAEGGNMEFAYPLNDEQYDAYLSELKATWTPNNPITTKRKLDTIKAQVTQEQHTHPIQRQKKPKGQS